MNISSNPGLYIHIPFCQSKCGYCDFYSIVDKSLVSPLVQALLTEIRRRAEETDPAGNFDTLYIGGGTPSLLSEKQLDRLINTLTKHFRIDKNCEITIEVNPGTIGSSKLNYLKTLGINRISIGIQSFIDSELNLLERIHTSTQAKNAIRASRENGFDNISLDLIFALPGQDLKDWQFSLQAAVDFRPEHLSVYNLTYEQGTPFYQRLQKGEIRALDDTEESRLFRYADSFLGGQGYHHYEISNYCLSVSSLSRHNYKYWTHVNYLGFGPGAHSFWAGTRRANIASVSRYIEDLGKGLLPCAFREDLSREQFKFEHIFLALRTYRGLDLAAYETAFARSFSAEFAGIIQKLTNKNLGVIAGGFFRLTNKGILLYDEILPDFSI
jgi:oxygen-independent coproporphyrinogen-3 oxidase